MERVEARPREPGTRARLIPHNFSTRKTPRVNRGFAGRPNPNRALFRRARPQTHSPRNVPKRPATRTGSPGPPRRSQPEPQTLPLHRRRFCEPTSGSGDECAGPQKVWLKCGMPPPPGTSAGQACVPARAGAGGFVPPARANEGCRGVYSLEGEPAPPCSRPEGERQSRHGRSSQVEWPNAAMGFRLPCPEKWGFHPSGRGTAA